MSKIYEKAAARLFTVDGWREAEELLEKTLKNKQPTDNLYKVNDALDIISELVEDSDKIELSYDGYHATIVIKTVGLDVPMYNMQVWRDLMNVVDGIAIEMRYDVIYIELTCKDVFA